MKTYLIMNGLFHWQTVTVLSKKEIKTERKALKKLTKALLKELGFKII